MTQPEVPAALESEHRRLAMLAYQMGQEMAQGATWKDNAHDHGCDDIRMWSVKRHGDSYRTLVVSRKHGT